jgi:hypothetical protein
MASLSQPSCSFSPRNSSHGERRGTAGAAWTDGYRSARRCRASGAPITPVQGIHDSSAQPPPTLTCCPLLTPPALSVHRKRGERRSSPTQPAAQRRRRDAAGRCTHMPAEPWLLRPSAKAPHRGPRGGIIHPLPPGHPPPRGGRNRKRLPNRNGTVSCYHQYPTTRCAARATSELVAKHI